MTASSMAVSYMQSRTIAYITYASKIGASCTRLLSRSYTCTCEYCHLVRMK